MKRALARVAAAWQMLQPRALAIARDRCPLCGAGLQLRLAHCDIGVRCLRCAASAVTQSVVARLRALGLPRRGMACLELSSRGALVVWLGRQACLLTTCSYDEAQSGGIVQHGIRCEDVQSLSFADASFDLCTCTEVFEHVADDGAGFRQVLRVLKPGGWFVFSVPIAGLHTIERTAMIDGQRRAVLAPTFHQDPACTGAPVLVHRDYGEDIVERLRDCGFEYADLGARVAGWFGWGRRVVEARRGT